mmetsp:Transcript_2456/g.8319  ORF Transcript_2456/g.8319 Transcript_2456/m.8319 type:complete len:382 (-) Transcript_2456:1125-2270(-)
MMRPTLTSTEASCRDRKSARSFGRRVLFARIFWPVSSPPPWFWAPGQREREEGVLGALAATAKRSSVRRTCKAAVDLEAASARQMPASVEKRRVEWGAFGAKLWSRTSEAMTVSWDPATAKTLEPARRRARAALRLGNVCPEWETTRATAPLAASAGVVPLGNAVNPCVWAPQVASKATAVNEAKTLFADKTRTRSFGITDRTFAAHCSPTHKDASTPTIRRSSNRGVVCDDDEGVCNKNRASAKASAVLALKDEGSRNESRIFCSNAGVSASSRPTTSPLPPRFVSRGIIRGLPSTASKSKSSRVLLCESTRKGRSSWIDAPAMSAAPPAPPPPHWCVSCESVLWAEAGAIQRTSPSFKSRRAVSFSPRGPTCKAARSEA